MKSELKETPQNIPSSNWNLDKKETNQYILDKLQKKKKLIDNYDGIDIHKSGNNYFVLSDDGWIAYLMSVKNDKIQKLKMDYATQVLVWRLYGKIGVSGIASYIFWNHLFPIHYIVMTDGEQTKEGQNFWKDKIAQALRRKLFVYRVNVRTGETIRISNGVDAFADDTYGDAKNFRLIRLVISKHELFKKS